MKTKRVKKPIGELDEGSEVEFPGESGIVCKIISKTSSQVVWKKANNCCGTSKPREEVHPL